MALWEAAGITPDDDPEMARRKLGDLVVSVIGAAAIAGDPGQIARHLALLSGLDTAADRSAVQADERTLQASVRRFLEALARRRPLCVLIEDIHWAAVRVESHDLAVDLGVFMAAVADQQERQGWVHLEAMANCREFVLRMMQRRLRPIRRETPIA